MTIRAVVIDADAVQTDQLPAKVRDGLSGTPGVAALFGVANHPLWRNAHARLARDLELLVAAGGKPADGLLVLTSLAIDVVRAQPLALATRGDARRRAAVAVQIAPHGRGEAERLIVVAVELSDSEWSRHEQELRQRLRAMGFDGDVPTYVLTVGGRLVELPSLRQTEPVDFTEAVRSSAGMLSFEIETPSAT